MIIIRVDANEQIGIGHIMRCLSVAAAFISAGQEVKFVTADHKGDYLIGRSGFDSICLESDYSQMEEEIKALIALIKLEKPSMFLVDSYYVTEVYFRELSRYTKIAYFDDMNSRRWSVDYLINYNVYSDILDYSWYSGSETKLLLGPIYTPLRDEFNNQPKYILNEKVSNIIVSAGGTDPGDIIGKIIKEICPYKANIKFHFVIGLLNPRLKTLKKLEKDNVVLHINETHMADLMHKCDIAIAAAGSTLYELCACGIPTITYILADNQIIAAKKFSEDHIMINAGDCRENTLFINELRNLIEDLINDYDKRKAFSNTMQTLVDGKGAKRIAKELSSQ